MSQQLVRTDEIKNALMPVQRQIKSLLQDDSRANKFMAASLVVASDRVLMRCQADSVVQALIGVAMLDLNVDKNVGHCYILPYGESAQLQVGYKGWIQLLFRAGWLVKCFPVYQCDDFSMSFDGWDNKVKFSPALDERDEGDKDWAISNLRGIYVVARNADTKDEYSTFVSKNIIEKLRRVSPNQKNSINPTGIWKDWYIEMSQAKAVKKLAKMLPIGDTRAAIALTVDDKNEIGKQIDYTKTAESGVVIDIEPIDVSHTVEPTLPDYPQADFDKNKANWKLAIESGKKTPEDIVVFLMQKATITIDMQQEIYSWGEQK